MKGIAAGRAYPVFWLPRGNATLAKAEAALLGRSLAPEDQRLFLAEFLKLTTDLERPFVAGDPDPAYGTVPPHMEALRLKLIEGAAAERGYGPRPATPASGDEAPDRDDPEFDAGP